MTIEYALEKGVRLSHKDGIFGKETTYTIEKALGQGGFGITYLAFVTIGNINHYYAIKEFFIKGQCYRDGKTDDMKYSPAARNDVEYCRKDFLDEAKRLNKICTQNQNIINVNEVFEANNTAYYVMEYLSGGSLRDRMNANGKPFSEAEALGLILPIAKAVGFLHEQHRLLHCDISPDNIMVARKVSGEEYPVLIDFGESLHFDQYGDFTHTHTAVGAKSGYAPTEQLLGVTGFEPRIDVYALGATLFSLLTAETPPPAIDLKPQFLESHIPTTVSPTTRRAILNAMKKDREDRTPSVAQFINQLEGNSTTQQQTTTNFITRQEDVSDNHIPPTPIEGKTVKKGSDLAGAASSSKSSNSKSTKQYIWGTIGIAAALFLACMLVIVFQNKTAYNDDNSKEEEAKATEVKLEEAAEATEVKLEEAAEASTFTVGGVSFEMVYVQGGTFTMGATSEQGSDAWDSEKPAHGVTLSSYHIGKTEVTQELWQAVMGSNPSYFKGSRRPVEQVSYDDCKTFISRLNSATGQSFRLPTEAEWEYAARGGAKSRGYKYSGSDSVGDVAWYSDNSGSQTHDVATKSPNELGIYDMSGNVYEWCSDWYGSYGSGSQSNPQGPSSGSRRVFRGGSWRFNAGNCRVAYRNGGTPVNRINNLGLRLAL